MSESTQSFRRIRSVFLTSLFGLLIVGVIGVQQVIPGAGGSFTVTNLADNTSGSTTAGSLRDGVNAANGGGCAAPCTINFAVSGSIFLSTPLTITATGVTINGFTAPGAATNTAPFGSPLSGGPTVAVTSSSGGSNAFSVIGPNVTIEGLAVHGFNTAISIFGTGARVAGCYIGTDTTGTTAGFATTIGIQINEDGATIGGVSMAERNLISATSSAGIFLTSSTQMTTIANNYIGTRRDAASALGNQNGIVFSGGGDQDVVGGATGANLISGNSQSGILVQNNFGTGPTIAGNRIGTNGAGIAALPNQNGISLLNSSGVTIGGTSVADRNIISGNTTAGIVTTGTCSNNFIKNNYIGTNLAGTAAIPNNIGVQLTNGATSIIIGGSGVGNLIAGNTTEGVRVSGGSSSSNVIQGNIIGLSSVGNANGILLQSTPNNEISTGNDIAFNTSKGIIVDGNRGNEIEGNSIHDNGTMGVDLLVSTGTTPPTIEGGPTPNDATDSDGVNGASGNNYQNYPAINSAHYDGSTLTVNFDLNSSGAPGTGSIKFQFFKADADGNEGQIPLGSQCLNGTTFSGATMNITTASIAVGDQIVGAATNFAGGGCASSNDGTSEFSTAAAVLPPPGYVINTNDSGPGSLRQAILDANSNLCVQPCTIVFNIPIGFATGSVFIIQPTSPLPNIARDGIQINGASQTAFTGDTNLVGPEIVLDGTLQAGFNGFVIDGSVAGAGQNNHIENINIRNFTTGAGIVVLGANVSNIAIAGNYIGTNETGTAAAPNVNGIELNAGVTNVFIGGAGAARNVISGNTGAGISVVGASNTTITGNFIGLDRVASNALGNGGNGIAVTGGATNTYIGVVGIPNIISANSVAGIDIRGPATTSTVVRGNRIGTDITGDAGQGNTFSGIHISDSGGNTIGGSITGEGNVISGNQGDGVSLEFAASDNNVIQGNRIGVDIDAQTSLGNGRYGIVIDGGSGNLIGGTVGDAYNIISGNISDGIRIRNLGSSGNVVQGNRIGVGHFTTSALANGGAGVMIEGADGNTIGGVVAGAGNIISGNTGDGVHIANATASGNAVSGNGIGNNLGGFPVPNLGHGVVVTNGAFGNIIGGGSAAGGNIITFNTVHGVIISGAGDGNAIRRNVIHTNSGMGIELHPPAGVNVNDFGDVDTGANELQNYPALTSATFDGINTTIIGTLNSTPSTTFDVDFYSNPTREPSGYGEGQSYLGTSTWTTDGSGNATVSLVVAGDQRSQYLTATATNNSTKDTSEFSNVIEANLAIAKTGPATVNAGTNFTYSLFVSNTGPSSASDVIVSDTLPAGTTFVSATGSLWSCTAAGLNLTCTRPTFAVSATAPITVTVTAPANGATLANTATVVAATPDPSTANNTSNSVTTSVVAQSDVQIAKTVSPSLGPVGSNFTFSINVTNSGPSNATNVVVSDTIPAGTTYVSHTTSQGSCTGTATVVCSIGTLNATASASVTIVVQGTTPGPNSNTATVTANEADPNTANNSSTSTFTVVAGDITIDKSGPSNARPGGNITYTIVVTNHGPGSAFNVQVDDPTPPRLTFVSNSDDCTTAYPCFLGTIPSGQSRTIRSRYSVQNGPATTVTNTATVSSTPADGNTGNNSSTETTVVSCPDPPSQLFPSQGSTGIATSGNLAWNGTGATAYRVFLGPANANGCETLLGVTRDTFINYTDLQQNTEYSWRVESASSGCETRSSACVTFRTGGTCNTAPPTLLTPTNGSTNASPINFSWTAVPGATGYDLYVGAGVAPTKIGATPLTSLSATVGDGPVTWFVVANGVPGCGSLQSATGSFGVCNIPETPLPSVIAETVSGQTYTVSWTPIAGAVRYELDEAGNAEFTGAQTQSLTVTSVLFTKIVSNPQPFFYRVRAYTACAPQGGPNSQAVRVVVGLPPPATDPNPSGNAPVGSTKKIVLQLFVPGQGTGNVTFTATVDQPWLAVEPASGNLPPQGITLTVTADPTGLPNGTFTGTVIVLVNDGLAATGRLETNTTTTSKKPFSISLVTPVTPSTTQLPSADTLIIPSVGHLDGFNSRWRSDIRVANTSTSNAKYKLTFTPEDPTKGIKETTIDVESGVTTALDDIVRNWYGVGSLGETSNGMLVIRPLDGSGNALPSNVASNADAPKFTIASSRTYNSTANGTLGQFIPAVPFANFIGRAASSQARAVLSLQQVAQSSAYRTNVGVVEATGQPVNLVLSILNNAGQRLAEVPLSLRGGEQRQLNGFLAQQGISLDDGRIEVAVANGDGRVTAYASVIDNRSGDPLLVGPVQLGTTQSRNYVLPGAADLNTGTASWRTDMRILNAASTSQSVQVTFFPQNNAGGPTSRTLSINAGETRPFDNLLQSFFDLHDVGGAVHVLTPNDSSLVVTGRTYNQTSAGTFGQFIPAVTPADAVAAGERALQILQAEESVRYRTNLGLAEVTGQPAQVEITVNLPGSRSTPRVQLDLAPNEFRQIGILRELGLDGAYNARISVKVLSGEGKVTAYGSVIDMVTQDPTYVPAQ